jgi:ABC-type oligopeptide transport system ATPase subunit
MTTNILAAENISLVYHGATTPALHSVSVTIQPGATLGIVGESGSGKSSLARCLLGVEKINSGHILFQDRNIHSFQASDWREFRRQVQMVFQDPYNSLNPRMTIGQALSEVLAVNHIVPNELVNSTMKEMLDRVGLHAAVAGRYPHELSGGQRQRVGIARALALKPSVIIADEPVSALDVSVQAQILNLLKDLIEKAGITLVLIAHDLAVVRYVCPRIIVMKQGRVVEEGVTEEVLDSPRDPYTRNLISAVPDIDRLLEAGHL